MPYLFIVRNLYRSFIVLFIALLPSAAWAKTETIHYKTSCDSLWQIVGDVLNNSGKYELKTIDATGHTATYQVGNAASSKIDTASLSADGDNCILHINAPFRGLINNDSDDFILRVNTKFNDMKHGKYTPPAASGATAATTAVSPGPAPVAAPASVVVSDGTAIALTVVAHCAKDPDPLGLVSNDFYSSCKQPELDMLRSAVAAGLQSRHISVAAAGQPAPTQLTVTLTRSLYAGGATDFSTGTMRFAATYQLAASGQPAVPGTVSYEEKGTSKTAENRFGDKIAADVAAKLSPAPAKN